jgi:hypothetical protein
VLGVWRRIECDQYPLNAYINRASHGLHLCLFRGHLPLDFLL